MPEKNEIELADGFALPASAVTQKIAILARSGAGKTYTAGVLVEGLLDAGRQVAIVDPIGVWWGLRLAADGKGKGVDVAVLGGLHGDLPLRADAGAAVAAAIASSQSSVVIDVSQMTGADQRRFVAAFGEAMLEAKKRHRGPILIVWEECQDFVPQRVDGARARVVGALEALMKQGRNFGIGTLLISQRPQAVNKDVLNQTEVLIVGQLTAPHDRDAIERWVEHSAADEAAAMLPSLPGLSPGEFWLWSPSWLRRFERLKIRAKRTFNASSTPDFDSGEAPRLPPINMAALRAALEPPPKAKAYSRIEEVVEDFHPAAPPKPIQVQVRSDAAALAALEAAVARATEAVGLAAGALADAKAAAARIGIAPPLALQMPRPAPEPAIPPPPKAGPMSTSKRQLLAISKANSPAIVEAIKALPSGAADILVAVLSLGGECSPAQAAMIAGIRCGGSTWRNYMARLKQAGLIHADNGMLAASAECSPHASAFAARTHDELLALWQPRLASGAWNILAEALAAYPGGVDAGAAAARCGFAPGGSTMRSYLGALRRAGLLSSAPPGMLRASDNLFPGDQP